MKFSALILAAGAGTRMVSSVPKVLHPLCGKPLLDRVIQTVLKLQPFSLGVVAGREQEQIMRHMSHGRAVQWISQKEPLGSGHAVLSAARWIEKTSKKASGLLVLCGDTPLISSGTLQALMDSHIQKHSDATILSSVFIHPFGYGRIVKDSRNRVRKIVEEKDADANEKKIREVNSGVYCFDSEKLLKILPHLENRNAKKEYYLTDAIEHFYRKNYLVATFSQPADSAGRESCETLGINSRADLAKAETILQRKILEGWMEKGVTLLNPSSCYIEEDVQIGKDTVILPGTTLLGKTIIGNGCRIGPNSLIENSVIGSGVTVRASFIYESEIGDGSQVGPFAHIRMKTLIAKECRIGNFTEIKKSQVGKGTKISHLAYVGDSELGEEINVGAGAITCNFDGKAKHKTVIGSKSFVGSNVNLIAPIKIGERTVLAAGSTITRNVPDDSLAIERSTLVIKEGWTKKEKNKK